MLDRKTKQKNITMRILDSQHLCATCLEEFGGQEPVAALYHCNECSLDFCQPDKLRHQKKNPTHILIELSESVVPNHRKCLKHGNPFDTFCRTCNQLICAHCSLGMDHRGHSCFLLQDIDKEERESVKTKWSVLNQQIDKWQHNINTSNDGFEKELVLIESERIKLREALTIEFDMLRIKLQERQDFVAQEIDQVCQKRTCLMKTIIEMKQKQSEFDNFAQTIQQVPIIELVEAKLTKLKELGDSFNNVTSQFTFQTIAQVHGMKLAQMDEPFRTTSESINHLASVVEDPSKASKTLSTITVVVNNLVVDDPSKASNGLSDSEAVVHNLEEKKPKEEDNGFKQKLSSRERKILRKQRKQQENMTLN